MAMENIQRFDEVTGKVFGELYQAFPVGRDFEPVKFFGELEDLIEPTRDDLIFFTAAMKWLNDSGYLKYEIADFPSGMFWGVVLSAKGLEALKAIPRSLGQDESLGERLIGASKSGAKSALGSLAGEVFSVGTRLATSYLNLPI